MATYSRESLERETQAKLDEIEETYAKERDELHQPFIDPNLGEIKRLDTDLIAKRKDLQKALQAKNDRQDSLLLAGAMLTLGALSFLGLAIALTRLIEGWRSAASTEQTLAPLSGVIASIQQAIRDLDLDRTVAIVGLLLFFVGVLRIALPLGSSLRQRLAPFMFLGPALVALPFYEMAPESTGFTIFEGTTFAALIAAPGFIWLRQKGFQAVVGTISRHARWIGIALGLIVLLVIVLAFTAKTTSPAVVTASMLVFALLGSLSPVLAHQGCAIFRRLGAYDQAASAHDALEARRQKLIEHSQREERERAKRLRTLDSRRSNKREAVLARRDELLGALEIDEGWSERLGRTSGQTATAGA